MDQETVRKVARVARLKLTDEELERYAADLEDILMAFSVLDEAPGAGGSSTSGPSRWRMFFVRMR